MRTGVGSHSYSHGFGNADIAIVLIGVGGVNDGKGIQEIGGAGWIGAAWWQDAVQRPPTRLARADCSSTDPEEQWPDTCTVEWPFAQQNTDTQNRHRIAHSNLLDGPLLVDYWAKWSRRIASAARAPGRNTIFSRPVSQGQANVGLHQEWQGYFGNSIFNPEVCLCTSIDFCRET